MEKTKSKIRDPREVRRVQKFFPNKTRAQQSFVPECDINTIMSRYAQTGIVEHLNRVGGSYGNFIGYQDYQTSMNQIMEAQEAFMSLPAAVRLRFKNDPAQFLAFAQDPSNQEEMISLGMATRKPQEAPDEPGPGSQDDPAITEEEAS